MSNRRADAGMFGFDFQINAAIVLMLENIKTLSSVRLEGNEEDIVLTLENNKKILAQAKAVQNASSDFNNVRANLKKALTTLSEGAQSADVDKLIFITNSPNPFKDDESRSIFYAPTRRKFSDLPTSAQAIIQEYLSTIAQPLNTDNFVIQVFNFETDDDKERYKVVIQEVNDFIGRLNTTTSPGVGSKLLDIWQNRIFENGSKKDAGITVSKKGIIWPLIVLETDISKYDDEYEDLFDIGVYEEVTRRYQTVIDDCCERVDFFTKILYDYKEFQSDKKNSKEKNIDFIKTTWEQYKAEFMAPGIDDETLEALTQIILYNVLRRRKLIESIRREVNL